MRDTTGCYSARKSSGRGGDGENRSPDRESLRPRVRSRPHSAEQANLASGDEILGGYQTFSRGDERLRHLGLVVDRWTPPK